MALPTVLITGCDQGIGLALAAHYADLKWNVIATVLDKSNKEELRRLSTVRLVEMDVSDQNSVTTAAVHLSGEHIDVLVNNAGVLIRGGLDELSQDEFMTQLQVNTVGPFLVTRAFLPNLRLAAEKAALAKVVNLGSRMGCLTEKASGGMIGYRASKGALHVVSECLAIDLESDKIAVVVAHPGHVATEMTGNDAPLSTHQSASELAKLIDGISMDHTGKFIHVDGTELPW